MDFWDGGRGAKQGTLTPVCVNGRGHFELNMISLRHQREPLLRLRLESTMVVQPACPDDQLEVWTSIEVTAEQLINFAPVSPKVQGRSCELRNGAS